MLCCEGGYLASQQVNGDSHSALTCLLCFLLCSFLRLQLRPLLQSPPTLLAINQISMLSMRSIRLPVGLRNRAPVLKSKQLVAEDADIDTKYLNVISGSCVRAAAAVTGQQHWIACVGKALCSS